jgi:hypothetical protein
MTSAAIAPCRSPTMRRASAKTSQPVIATMTGPSISTAVIECVAA